MSPKALDLQTDSPKALSHAVTDEDKEQFDANIFWATGKQWSAVRSACEPLFHSSSLESYGESMHEDLDQWLAVMDKLGQGTPSSTLFPPYDSACHPAETPAQQCRLPRHFIRSMPDGCGCGQKCIFGSLPKHLHSPDMDLLGLMVLGLFTMRRLGGL